MSGSIRRLGGMSVEEEHELRAAFRRDAGAREWNSLPTAIDKILAEREQAHRARLAKAWSAFLSVALEDHDEDGVPLLATVLNLNPALRERLRIALRED